ncbi:MAG TPA: energy transducer TonB [Thermoanaerobaculia bacterium]|nr:energy transducer TonB [Thermoanaerobaculia bacterium]
MKSFVRILPLFLVFAAPMESQTLDEWVSQKKFSEAAKELERIAVSGEPVDEAVLRRAIETARGGLGVRKEKDRKAARQVLCMARAHFPEEDLPRVEGEPEEPLRVKDAVERPRIISSQRPGYPATAQGIHGTVILEGIIDREGCIRRLNVLQGLPGGLSEAAVAAVRNWTFEPATLKGEPVNVYYSLTVNFRPEAVVKSPK